MTSLIVKFSCSAPFDSSFESGKDSDFSVTPTGRRVFPKPKVKLGLPSGFFGRLYHDAGIF